MAHTVLNPRNAITSEYDYEEQCPYCGNVIPIVFDINEKCLEITCPMCGKKIMICTACIDWNNACDWKEGSGCHMDKNSKF